MAITNATAKRITPRQAAIDRKRNWNLAISEGRVVRSEYQGRVSAQSFATIEARDAHMRELELCGIDYVIVDPALADLA